MPNRIRAIRQSLGLSQDELARRAGITRQTLILMEKGRMLPRVDTALRLARALQVPVEALFPEEVPAPVGVPLLRARVGHTEILTPLTGRHASLDVFSVPDQLVAEESQTFVGGSPQRQDLVLVGCDPFASWIKARLEARHPHVRVVLATMGSAMALSELARGRAHAAGVHAESPEENRRLCRQRLPFPFVLVDWLVWRAGFVWGAATREQLEEVHTLVLREEGAEARRLLVEFLSRAGADPGRAFSGQPEALGHVQVGLLVASLPLGAGVSLEPVARLFGLAFTPLREEHYQICIPEHLLGTPPVDALLDTLSEPGWEALKSLGVDPSLRGRLSA